MELLGRAADAVRDDDDAPAVQKRAPDFPDGEVEGDGMEHSPHVGGAEAEPGVGAGEKADDVAVGDAAALGLAGGAGGVDDVGERVGCGGWDGVGDDIRREVVDAKDVRGVLRERGGEVALGEEHGGARVFEDESDALGGIGEVEREVGAAGFEDGEEADDEFGGALHAEADDDFRPDAERAQMRAEQGGAVVEFAVGELGFLAGEGDGVGRAGGLVGEDFVEGLTQRRKDAMG